MSVAIASVGLCCFFGLCMCLHSSKRWAQSRLREPEESFVLPGSGSGGLGDWWGRGGFVVDGG